MQAISPEEVTAALAAFIGRPVYLHLETTAGAYTEGGFGAFIRNAQVVLRRAAVRGRGPYRAGLQTELGWIYAEGLTDWERDAEGRLLLAGHEGQGRVTVVCELADTPFVVRNPPARLNPEPVLVPGLQAPTIERAVLVVLAHPDDETFGCGGTIALYAHGGVPVTCAIATRGEMGRNMGKPTFATRESLHQLRQQELTAACAVLGVRDLRLLGCWDKTTEFMDEDGLADQVAQIIEEVRPSLVITSHPVHGGHPDHCAIGAATLTAIRRLPISERPVVHVMVPQRVADQEGIAVETVETEAVRPLKEQATLAHRSQSEPMLGRLSDEELARRRQRLRQERFITLEV